MTPKEINHTTIRNGNLFCLNCGSEHKLMLPIEINDMTKMIDAFNVLHKDCEKTWSEAEADLNQDIRKRAMWWLSNGEKGNSSETMWNCFMGNENFRINHPYDPDDFKRCYKLLKVVPEWKQKRYFDKLSQLSIPWKNLTDNWDKLTEMYEQNLKENWANYKKVGMYEFMKKLIR